MWLAEGTIRCKWLFAREAQLHNVLCLALFAFPFVFAGPRARSESRRCTEVSLVGESSLAAIRYILAVVLAFVVGSFVNISLVNLGPTVFPLPEGADITTVEGLQATMGVMKPVNFIFPYLGHALGTLAGATIAAFIAPNHKFGLAMGCGVFFLFGGITAVALFGGPLWFMVLDLVTAYIPMGYLGWLIAGGNGKIASEAESPVDNG